MKTPQYIAIKENCTDLASSLVQVLEGVTGKCFESGLISKKEWDTAYSQREKKSSEGLVGTILDKIKSHIKWYEVFIKILAEYTELDDIVRDITTSFTTASGNSSRSGYITTSFTTASGSSSGSGMH